MLKLHLTFFLILLFFFPHISYSRNFLPENDLWKEDYFMKSRTGQLLFNRIIEIAYDIYKPIAEEFGDDNLSIYGWWENSTVNANSNRFYEKVIVNMYGGLFRRPEITLEGFALVLCHELSHAYGGYPYIMVWNNISAEGQADYAAT